MSIILFPFKILGVPAQALLGLVGVILAAIANAWIFRQAACWAAWNLGWSFMNLGMLNVITIAAFFLTFFAVSKK